jgi:hypothetical protein
MRDLLGQDAEEVTPAAEPEAPVKKTRKPRAEKTQPEPVATPEPTQNVDRAAVLRVAQEYAAVHGIAAAKELIAKAAPGSTRITEVPDDQLQAVYEAFTG